jgi:hypothetical protein
MKKNNHKVTQEEFMILSKKTKDELRLTNPAAILDALGVEYKQKGARYEFQTINDEKVESANMYIDSNGEWKYKDFSNGNNGTIENLIMDATNATYKEALEYAIIHSHVRDYVREKLDELKGKNVSKKSVNLTLKREENIIKSKSQVNSKAKGLVSRSQSIRTSRNKNLEIEQER